MYIAAAEKKPENPYFSFNSRRYYGLAIVDSGVVKRKGASVDPDSRSVASNKWTSTTNSFLHYPRLVKKRRQCPNFNKPLCGTCKSISPNG